MPQAALPLPDPVLRDPAALALRLALAALALAALLILPWLSVAPNRLLPGRGVLAIDALGLGGVAVAALITASALADGLQRFPPGIAFGLTLAALLAALVLTGSAAGVLLQGRPTSARAMLGAGFWTATTVLALLALEHARVVGRSWPLLVGLGCAAVLAVAAMTGAFDRLSLAVELRARGDVLLASVLRHLALSAVALLLALGLAIPLGWTAFRHPRTATALGAALSAIQVVPAIALFGLLIPLIAALLRAAPGLREVGMSAIGPTPALVGVALYLMLPLVRGLVSGLRAADGPVVDAARAMGMGEGRITWEVRVPLGLPVLAGALRVAAVQSIGLVTLGGLIGAGGLGAVVFEGMSQLASDLILLGALPIVALALVADAALGALQASLGTRR